MPRKKIILAVIIGLIFVISFFWYQQSQYEKIPFHYWVYTGSENKQLYTSTFSELLKILDHETWQEKGKGIMEYEYINSDQTKARIMLQQTYTGGDSIGPSKYYFIAEKQKNGWTVIEYGRRFNCLRGGSYRGCI